MARNLDVEYKMRMTQGLKEKIVESAKEHNRSMNAEIIKRLEESFFLNENYLDQIPTEDLLKYAFSRLNINSVALTREEVERGTSMKNKYE